MNYNNVPLEVKIDTESPPGNVIGTLARLLIQIGDREAKEEYERQKHDALKRRRKPQTKQNPEEEIIAKTIRDQVQQAKEELKHE